MPKKKNKVAKKKKNTPTLRTAEKAIPDETIQDIGEIVPTFRPAKKEIPDEIAPTIKENEFEFDDLVDIAEVFDVI